MIHKHFLLVLLVLMTYNLSFAQQEVLLTEPELQSIVEKISLMRASSAEMQDNSQVIDDKRRALLRRYAVLEDKLRRLNSYYKYSNIEIKSRPDVEISTELTPPKQVVEPVVDKNPSNTNVTVNVEKDTVILVQGAATSSSTAKDSLYLLTLQKLLDKIDALENTQVEAPTVNVMSKGKYRSEKKSLLYDNNQFVLGMQNKASLQSIATSLNNNPDLDVLIEGFTSEKGSAAYNAMLSQKRAEAAKQFLVQQGIHPNRIFTEYHGIDYSTDESQARRVDVYLIENTFQRN